MEKEREKQTAYLACVQYAPGSRSSLHRYGRVICRSRPPGRVVVVVVVVVVGQGTTHLPHVHVYACNERNKRQSVYTVEDRSQEVVISRWRIVQSLRRDSFFAMRLDAWITRSLVRNVESSFARRNNNMAGSCRVTRGSD